MRNDATPFSISSHQNQWPRTEKVHTGKQSAKKAARHLARSMCTPQTVSSPPKPENTGTTRSSMPQQPEFNDVAAADVATTGQRRAGAQADRATSCASLRGCSDGRPARADALLSLMAPGSQAPLCSRGVWRRRDAGCLRGRVSDASATAGDESTGTERLDCPRRRRRAAPPMQQHHHQRRSAADS